MYQIMKIYLKIEDGVIKDAKFETLGCAAAIAVSSSLTDLVIGKTLEEALKVTKDSIVADVHFFAQDDPQVIARKLLRVNVSDLAAKGAIPKYFLLSAIYPRPIHLWGL